MVPGIAPSADPMLQARMFAYPDAARYRLGVNYQQLPSNAAHSPVYSPYERDGFATTGKNYGGDPNYVRSGLRLVALKGQVGAKGVSQHDKWVGEVAGFTSEVVDDDFVQPRGLWEVLGRTEGQQENFVANVADNLKGALPEVQKETFGKFYLLVLSSRFY
jgi:catalase